jgi:hypothetical protein
LLGDCGYPLLDWLITPYREDGHLTQQRKYYNKKHSSTRIKIEQAFGLLKSRWRCLRNNLEISIDIVPHVISTCCILHNICMDRDDNLVEGEYENDTDLLRFTFSNNNNNNSNNSSAINLRENVNNYLWAHRNQNCF